MDDLYNNLKIYEAEVMGSSSMGQNTQNVAFVSSNNTGSTNEAVKTAHGVSAANSKANASTLPNVDSLSDVVIYSFFANQGNGHEVHMAMLIMRVRRFLKKTRRNLGVNGTNTIGFDKTKVECYNFHRSGHFAREYRAHKYQDNRNRETTRRTVSVEETTSNALVSQCDGFGYDWSDQAKEGPTNFALITYTSSGSSNSSNSDTEVSTCSKACLKSYETLKEHYDNLTKDFNKSQLNIGAYKAGLESIEAGLEVYKKNEAIFEEDIKILKLDIIESVTSVPVVVSSEVKTRESKSKYVNEPLIEDWISHSEDENETKSKSNQRKPSFAKIEFVKYNNHVKSPRESVKKVEYNKQAKYPRKNSQRPRGNKSNWNNLMTHKLESNFEFKNKACYVCGSFNHLIKDCDFYEKKMVEKPFWNNARRVNNQNSQRMSHPHPKRKIVPKAVLMKSSLKTLNTVRQNSSRAAVSVNTARPINTAYPRPKVNCARPTSNVFNKAHSHVTRLFNKFTTNKNTNFNEKVNTVKGNVTTAWLKAVVSDNKGNEANVVKASACWDKGVIDNGCSRHMTGNRSYLTDYEEIDGGFIAFGGSTKGGKITRKRKIRTDFKLTDESHVLLKVPRKDNMYNIYLKNVVPQGGLTCLFAKATLDESNLWHRRLGHINFKTMNKLLKGKNRTLIEATRTMLSDSKLPTTFWAEAVNTACYVQNRVLVIKPYNKTPYELFHGRTPSLSFMRPFGCPVTILNTLDHLGKFDGKADEGFFIGYSRNSKAFRVFNSRTMIVEETLHVTFLENKPNVEGSGPTWIFDIDTLTKSMNYEPVVAGNQSNGSAGTKACNNVGKARVETVPGKDYIMLPLWTQDPPFSSSLKDSPDAGFKPSGEEKKKDVEHPENKDSEVLNIEEPSVNQEKDEDVNIYGCADDLNMPNLEEIVSLDYDEDVSAEADMTNLDTHIHRVTDHEPKKVIQALTDPSWIKAMQDELLQLNCSKFRHWWIYHMARGPLEQNGSIETRMIREMDVKSSFLYGKIEEEVYVCQPLGFEDPEFLDRVYKVEKALYGLHQDPKAWSIRKEIWTEFEKMMHKKFQISYMGELTFFLGLTLMETSKPLMKDENGEDVDVHFYRSMIGSLMYLTSSRPNIMFAVCAFARFQVTPKVSHLHAMKTIFRYLKGQPKLGLLYPKDSPFDLKAYTDSDDVGPSLDRKSTIRADDTVHEEREDRMERAATTASSLEA
ncbi:putative ribonuclease H-like domain-containing protein [Tanacetum coccineum]